MEGKGAKGHDPHRPDAETPEDTWLRTCRLPRLLEDNDWLSLRANPHETLEKAYSMAISGGSTAKFQCLLAGWFSIDPRSALEWANLRKIDNASLETALIQGYFCRPNGYEEFKELVAGGWGELDNDNWRNRGTSLGMLAFGNPVEETKANILRYLADHPTLADQYAYSMSTNESARATLDLLDAKGYAISTFVTAGYSGFADFFVRFPVLAMDVMLDKDPAAFMDNASFHLRHSGGDLKDPADVVHWIERNVHDARQSDQLEEILGQSED